MKGWRGHAADIFAKHGEIASKMKSVPGPDPSDFSSAYTSELKAAARLRQSLPWEVVNVSREIASKSPVGLQLAERYVIIAA